MVHTLFLLLQTMNKTNLIIAICFCALLASCRSTELKTYSVNYMSIRQKYAQPTQEEPIPDEAKIAVAYAISENGELAVNIQNRTSDIMIIDKVHSYFVNTDGKSTSYYDPTIKNVSTTDLSTKTKGMSVNLGSVAKAFGVGGIVGDLASGITVGGSGTSGGAVTQETIVADQPQVSLAPNSNTVISRVFTVSAIAAPSTERREIIKPYMSHKESPCKFSVCISYSTDNGATFEKLVTEFYADAYLNVPIKTEGRLGEALNVIEQSRPDMYNTPWWMLHFNSSISEVRKFVQSGIIYDYQ